MGFLDMVTICAFEFSTVLTLNYSLLGELGQISHETHSDSRTSRAYCSFKLASDWKNNSGGSGSSFELVTNDEPSKEFDRWDDLFQLLVKFNCADRIVKFPADILKPSASQFTCGRSSIARQK